MSTVLITGANRGIGLALARRAAKDGWRVHATCRRPDAAQALRGLDGDIAVHGLDVRDGAAIADLAAELTGEAIDVLVNNAGVLHQGGLGSTDDDAWLDSFRVNTMAPMRMTACFQPHLGAGERRLVACLSSIMGSIANCGGGSYPYRSSKAALNMVVAALAADLRPRGITVAAFHPGWVRTDMGGPSASLTAEDSARRLWRCFARLTSQDSGGFFDPDGAPLPW